MDPALLFLCLMIAVSFSPDPVRELIQEVHTGYFSTVRIVRERHGGRSRFITEKRIIPSLDSFELDVLEYLSHQPDLHPNIMRVYGHRITRSGYAIIDLEVLDIDLFYYLQQKSDWRLPEEQAARFAYQLFDALQYLHEKCVVHFDLKLENVMLKDQEKADQIKVVDFGLARFFKPGRSPPIKKCTGTACTMAPEAWKEQMTEKCDIWSAGVVVYNMIAGRNPFRAHGSLEEKPSYPPTLFSDQSSLFLGKIFEYDPKMRPSAEKVLKEKWIRKHLVDHDNIETFTQPECFKALQSAASSLLNCFPNFKQGASKESKESLRRKI